MINDDEGDAAKKAERGASKEAAKGATTEGLGKELIKEEEREEQAVGGLADR